MADDMSKTLKNSLLSILFGCFYALVDKIGQQTAYSLNIQAHYLLHPSLFFLLQSCRHPSIDTARCSAKSLRHCAQYATKIQPSTKTGLGKNSDRRQATELPDIQHIAIYGLLFANMPHITR